MTDYGLRADNTPKGAGFFGELKRPDGNISTEISIGVNINNKETEIPLLVPTLNKNEVDWLLKTDPKSKSFFQELPQSILRKAVNYASYRIKANKSPFAEAGEIYDLPSD